MNPSVKTKIRLGRIAYINSLPFYHRLTDQELLSDFEVEWYENYPTKVNLAMRQGKVDVGLVSSLEYLNHQKDYRILPDLALGSRDFSGSVLLLSKQKIEKLNGVTVALSRQSLSSAVLLRILLRFKYKFHNRFVSADGRTQDLLAKHKAALAIGDDAFFYRPAGFIYKYDLSELWWRWTEKPFCFAIWVVRREYAESHPRETEIFREALARNRDQNLANLEGMIQTALGIGFLDNRFPKVYGYFFNLYYHLDVSGCEGLELFYRLAHRLGVSPHIRGLDFFQG